MKNFPLPRLDANPALRDRLLEFSRLNAGETWNDPLGKHRIGCLDAASREDTEKLMEGERAVLAIHDPPYNLVAFQKVNLDSYVQWCRKWIDNTDRAIMNDSSLYVWLGADQRNNFQPLPDFILMMRDTDFASRSFISMRNQRGYGTLRNWMAVRQELLYYTKGSPTFNVGAEYTDIPKILRGYYKEVDGKLTENVERSKSSMIRAGNVWVDIQQVFYRMPENVNGCYAQKPLKSAERIITASSNEKQLVVDFFSHSGTTLLASEMSNRRCFTIDSDPVYCEITLRRLERFRKSGATGWQNGNPFEEEIRGDSELADLIQESIGAEPVKQDQMSLL